MGLWEEFSFNMEMGTYLMTALALAVAVASSASFLFYLHCFLRPEKIRRALRKQGIGAPPPTSLLLGNIPEIRRIASEAKARSWEESKRQVQHHHPSMLFPYINLWEKQYGPVFFYSNGNIITLHVGDLDLAKEIYECNSMDLGKPFFVKRNQGALIGGGVLSSNGDSWARQRKIIAPEFFMGKVKGMVDLMVESTIPLLTSWEAQVEQGGGVADIRVDEGIKAVAADVISRACFGSSYSKGKAIFSQIRSLQQTLTAQSSLIGIPGLRYLPTESNRKIWALAEEIRTLILKVVEERRGRGQRGGDLLGTLIEGAGGEGLTADDFVVDNCKNVYFAGHETTASVAKWVLVLLASHPVWQARVGDEVTRVVGEGTPTADMLTRMPVLTMAIQETLRLYPPAPLVLREALGAVKLGNLLIPKGTLIRIPRIRFHHDPKIWGPNAGEFEPRRFERGVAGACKFPVLYNPFGVGVRSCLGANFAMMELKVLLSLIFSRFHVSLSPNYRHGVAFRLVLESEHGVELLVKKRLID